jgi:hypothetical protein
MAFVNRRLELARIVQFVQGVQAGTPERHLALVGVRRIGKSRIIEHYLEARPPVVAITVQMDEATTTLQTFLLTTVRAVLVGLARHAGVEPPPAGASLVQLATTAGRVGDRVGEVVGRALDRAGERRPDGQQLFQTALALPGEVAEATSTPMVVFADEFQHILNLATYPPFRTGRGRSGVEAQANVLRVFRAGTERRPHVGWVVTGSSVRLLREILGQGALMGRFDIVEIEAFDARDTAELASTIWSEVHIRGVEAALDRMYVLTGGNPFYTDVAARRAAFDALALQSDVTSAMVDRALLESVHSPNGAIYIACQEMWESLHQRVPALRGILLELARRGEATVADLLDSIGLASESLAWRHVTELQRLGFVDKVEEGRYRVIDPVLRYWIVAASNPLEPRPELGDPEHVRRAAVRFEEAYLRERQERGSLAEGYIRDLVSHFDGQRIDGRRFGAPGSSVKLPTMGRVSRVAANDPGGEVFGVPSEIELDLCFGDPQTWLAEVRDRTRRATAADVELLWKKAVFLRRSLDLGEGPTWLISMAGADGRARARAGELGMYVSGRADVQAIQAATGIQRRARSASVDP